MRKHWRYLSYVVRHKWFVFLAGLKTGAPLWRLVIHDWSKFTWLEWTAYAEYFYGRPHVGEFVQCVCDNAPYDGVIVATRPDAGAATKRKPWPFLYRVRRHDGFEWWVHPGEIERRPESQEAFDRAWLHHQHLNPHHWQHWVLRQDDGQIKVLEMPSHFVREMVADWMGAGRAITGKWEACEWYLKNRGKMQLALNTRWVVECLLDVPLGQMTTPHFPATLAEVAPTWVAQ